MNAAQLRLMLDAGLSLEQVVQIAEAGDRKSSGAERQARYRARGGDKIPPDMRAAVFDRDNHQCQECGSEDHLHCDHIIPVSKGGPTEESNLQVLCRVCNSRKRDRIRKSDERKSAELIGRSTDNPRTTITPLSEEITPPSPPKGGSSPAGGSRPERRQRGSRFVPDDFAPNEAHLAKAEAQGLSPGDMERALARFKNHEFQRAYTDWSRCFHKWLDREKPSHDPANCNRPDRRHAARLENYDAHWAGAEQAVDLMAARRTY